VFNIFVKRTSGVGTEEMLLESPVSKYLDDWSRDGKWLLYQPGDLKNGRDLWAIAFEGVKRYLIANTEFEEKEAVLARRPVGRHSRAPAASRSMCNPFPTRSARPIQSWGASAGAATARNLLHWPDGMMAAPITLAPNGKSVEPATPIAPSNRESSLPRRTRQQSGVHR
jgi:hypothetical protein